MFHLLAFAGIISAIALLARANKSNKLFWILLVSACLGYAGGSMNTSIKKYSKKDCVVQKFLLQGTDAITSDVNMYKSICVLEEKLSKSVTRVFNTEPVVSKPKQSDRTQSRTTLAFNPDYDIGSYQYPNTS